MEGNPMQCPACNTVTLVMTDRLGIEIDYCPKCRGVWLDRGELDKIIDRSVQGNPPADLRSTGREQPMREDNRKYYDDDDKYRGYPRKRRGFLGDLFDFD